MNINDFTIGQAKELVCLFGSNNSTQAMSSENSIDCEVIGVYAIIRTYSAGVWFGKVLKKANSEIVLEEARRLYYWKTNSGISLSEVSLLGLHPDSKVCATIDKVWLQAIEIMPCTLEAIKNIKGQEDYVIR